MARPIRDPILEWLGEMAKTGLGRTLDTITFSDVSRLESKIRLSITKHFEKCIEEGQE